MPFTFAHPAIVLPCSKKYFSLTALIIGSIIPDFEYFIRMRVYSVHSHTLSGLLYFDLPIGFAVYYLFVKFIRVPLIIHFPEIIRKLFNLSFAGKSWLVILYSLVIGAASHLLWDSFTHAEGYFVRLIPLLSKKIILGAVTLPVFKVLQHGSSIVGLLVIAIVILQQLPGNIVQIPERMPYYWGFVFIITLAFIIIGYFTRHFAGLGDYVVGTISGTLVGISVTSIYYHVRVLHRRTV